ncbi:hypothetical protein BDV40DRAFT_294685 [Aspergillus tamarii]|uniref:C2H2-type domain-containing protein n=1 Tax=Aspergillus tamarii TaxID=41984 RepID=A0A5N6VBC8_ASPTM|nr:hypothetical protein BDV40DRAFT_294685 [Aspergillus tamarii]
MYKCETCKATFDGQDACEKHMDDSNHRPECEICSRTFRTWRACEQHMDDTAHWAPRFYCQTCSREFFSQSAANQHMTAVRHWNRVPCVTRNTTFLDNMMAELDQIGMGFFKTYCWTCCRKFQSENSLQMHLKSTIHRGSNIPCPFCKAEYTSASSLTHHLEQGSCPRADILNRETILHIVQERDPHRAITNEQLECHTIKEGNSQHPTTTNAFNGSCWECYLCHGEFSSATALDSHLSSPAHKQAVYHCPNSKDKCAKEFTTLAALFDHLESEACSYIRFEKVEEKFDAIFLSWKPIKF